MLWGLLLIVVVGLLLWFFGIGEFEIDHRVGEGVSAWSQTG
jgi:cellobiose-specific phosphotransferase system component IIC